MTVKKKTKQDILPLPQKKREGVEQITNLAYALLSVISQYERKDPGEMLKDILKRKKTNIDPTSAVLIFVMSYLSHYHNSNIAAKN